MARRQPNPGMAERLFLRVFFLLVAIVGVLAILHFSGIYRIPALSEPEPEQDKSAAVLPEGMVLVPVAARSLRAYEQVRGVDLYIASRGVWAELPLSEARVKASGVVRSRKEVLGRVLKRDKPSGRVFTADDFYPEGTRPGLTAGIPPGKRAVRIEVSRIQGLHGLARGDLVDLIYTFEVDSSTTGRDLPRMTGARGAEMEMQARLTNPGKQSAVKIAARGAVVVEPVSIRQMPITSNSLTRGTVSKALPVQEVVLAMDPSEAVALTAALQVDARVFALPRSGNSADDGDSEVLEPPVKNPYADGDSKLEGVRVVEIIDGSEKKVIAVPGK